MYCRPRRRERYLFLFWLVLTPEAAPQPIVVPHAPDWYLRIPVKSRLTPGFLTTSR